MKHYRTLAFYPSSKGDKHYTVKIDEEGNLSCDCPGWIYSYHRNGGVRTCKHVIAAREEFSEIIKEVKGENC